jgi:Ca2+-binding RTX toxin-like protein
MTIKVDVLTPGGSDPDWYTFLALIDGAGTDSDPVFNDTSTKFNAEVSLLDAVFATTGTGFTYDALGRPLGTGTISSSTLVESGTPTIKYTHTTPLSLQTLIDAIVRYAVGNPEPNQEPDPFEDTSLLDQIYMNDDYIYNGNSGDDTFMTGWRDDKLNGKAGNDELYGNDGADRIEGGAGNDFLDGGDHTFTGDWATYATAVSAVTVNLSQQGSAQNTGGGGTDTLVNFENLQGSNFNDTLVGDLNDNFLEGGAGNDTLNGGGQNGSFSPWGGDFASYNLANAGVRVSLLLQGAGQNTVGAGTDTLIDIESITGSKFDDRLTGDANDNIIEGYLGNDIMVGGDNTALGDMLAYILSPKGVTVDLSIIAAQNTNGAGTDTISGFENIFGSHFNDKLSGNGGDNLLIGEDGNDTIKGSAGADFLDGGNGVDTASYAGSNSGVFVDLNVQDGETAQAGTGDENGDILSGIENLIGSDGDDTLIGDGEQNSLNGGLGADTLTGNLGKDFFRFSSVLGIDDDTITDFDHTQDKIDLALIDARPGVAGNQAFRFIGVDEDFTGRKGDLIFDSVTSTLQGDTNGDSNADFELTLEGFIGAEFEGGWIIK